MCQLCHNLLKLVVANNSRSADTLQSLDAVELLLDQLPSGWNPPVIEVFVTAESSRTHTSLSTATSAHFCPGVASHHSTHTPVARAPQDALMRRRGEGGYQLFKSNVKKLVDTIHAELQKKEHGQARAT